MGYYGSMRGDYYQGDYYRGDPGFFSFLGNLAKKAVGGIPGVGPAVSTAISLVGRRPQVLQKVGPIVTGVLKRRGVKAGLALGGAALIGGVLGRSSRGMHGMAGHHRRRMNVCNPKALRKAIRRTHGFAKLAMRTIHLVHPQKKARFGGFKKKRAKR